MPGADAVVKVAVCIPFVNSGCPWRLLAFDWVTTYWGNHHCDVVVGSASEVNRSAARNDAAKKTQADVLVFSDADTFIGMPQFDAMVEIAAVTDRLVHGYRTHVKLSKRSTLKLYETGDNVAAGERIEAQPLGIVAVSRRVWETVGGFDERFVGWGGEDRAFELACMTLCGTGHRIPGDSYHLWHPNDPSKGRATPQRRANQRLALRYKEAAGTPRSAGILGRTHNATRDPAAMLAILSEPDAPLDGADVSRQKLASTTETW